MTNGKTGTTQQAQYRALNIARTRTTRFNLYPGTYWNSGNSTATPQSIDAAILQAYSYGITPMILFEHYGGYGSPGDYNKWYTIGREFALRFAPNSAYLQSQGISNWGVDILEAMNEPGINTAIDKTEYHEALRGLADGAHSVRADVRVIPGGYASPNAYRDFRVNGYVPAIADLLNNGTLAGIDLHTYNDDQYAPLVGSLDFSTHRAFAEIKSQCGITRDIEFFSTEFNYKAEARLHWAYPGQAKQAIPRTRLYPAAH